MKNKLLKTGVVIAVFATLLLVFKEPIKQTAYGIVTEDMFVKEDSDDFDPGLDVGDPFPEIAALFDGREINSIERFVGTNGFVFLASRSFDWCPYCMGQFIQLQAYQQQFEDAGIGLLAMTYDTPELQQAFVAEHKISIPLASDMEAQTFEALGIINAEYAKGDEHYGLPYPGMFVVNLEGVIVGKLFVEAYSSRVDAKSALAFAKVKLDINN